MLILPPGHGEMLRTRPKLGRRERLIAIGVGTLAVAITLVSLLAIGLSSAPTVRGCVNATIPGPIGATTFHECGASARRLCSTLAPGQGLSPYGLGVLDRACRKGGLAVPAAPARRQ